ncbi:abortive infection family protein [Corynebacterium silvaticum]|uniref:abortive infection family protein n=1 Tax=Corynebacterium silvaticum TaxID=2320431 RepID=UPI001419379D|nr:abortive infection family protein [Corynebacterium silvaticum]MBH5299864.1 abortive infection family protein [Corynebacterium silvaticum]NOM65756.1 abortive infection family protein [Corynebacterium silvaticum]
MLTSSTVRTIEGAFRDEGFQPKPNFQSQDSSERRATAESFLAGLDWSSAETSIRLARAMETLLESFVPGEILHDSKTWSKFVRLMGYDGWEVSDNGKVTPPANYSAPITIDTSRLTDPSGVHEQLERLRNTQGDAPAVIGASKELVEATAKAILRELNPEVSPVSDFPDLIKAVNEALGLSPGARTKGIDSTQSVKRILGGATNIVLSLNELRNSHGTGHGPSTARTGLYKRHADLAINAATLWCQLVVDTFNDPHAPWRKR